MGSERSKNEELKQNTTQVLLTLTFIYVTIGYYALDQQPWYSLLERQCSMHKYKLFPYQHSTGCSSNR